MNDLKKIQNSLKGLLVTVSEIESVDSLATIRVYLFMNTTEERIRESFNTEKESNANYKYEIIDIKESSLSLISPTVNVSYLYSSIWRWVYPSGKIAPENAKGLGDVATWTNFENVYPQRYRDENYEIVDDLIGDVATLQNFPLHHYSTNIGKINIGYQYNVDPLGNIEKFIPLNEVDASESTLNDVENISINFRLIPSLFLLIIIIHLLFIPRDI